MTENLVQGLYEILSEYGAPVLSTPRMFEIVLAQRVRATPEELHAIQAAVQGGAVTDLLNSPEMDLHALANSAAARVGLPVHTMRWSLDIWRVALLHVKVGKPPPVADFDALRHVPPPDEKSVTRRAVAAFMLIAFAGSIAGSLPGILIANDRFPHSDKMRLLVEKRELPGVRMSPREFAGWTGTLGGIGGCLGAALGWLAGNYKPITLLRILGGLIGASWAFDAAAFGMAYYGLYGVFFGPLFAGASCVLLSTLLGPFSVLMAAKPLSWWVVPHF